MIVRTDCVVCVETLFRYINLDSHNEERCQIPITCDPQKERIVYKKKLPIPPFPSTAHSRLFESPKNLSNLYTLYISPKSTFPPTYPPKTPQINSPKIHPPLHLLPSSPSPIPPFLPWSVFNVFKVFFVHPIEQRVITSPLRPMVWNVCRVRIRVDCIISNECYGGGCVLGSGCIRYRGDW